MDVILLGEIQSLIDGVNTNIANAKSVIDTINNNTKANNTASETGTLSQKLSSIISYTKTNNTASTTGTLSQKISSAIANTAATTTENASGTLSAKLTYLINRRDMVVVASNTVIKTIASNATIKITSGTGYSRDAVVVNGTQYLAYVKHSGTYRVYITVSQTNNTNTYNKKGTAGNGYMEAACQANTDLLFYHSGGSATISLGTNTGSVAAVTKTYDLTLAAGGYVSAQLKLTGYPNEWDYYCDNNTRYAIDEYVATLVDFSLRGTTYERNGITT